MNDEQQNTHVENRSACALCCFVSHRPVCFVFLVGKGPVSHPDRCLCTCM